MNQGNSRKARTVAVGVMLTAIAILNSTVRFSVAGASFV